MLCSLVGDPKTALTIVSHRAFLKFIPVMSDIQRMDVAAGSSQIPVGASLLAKEVDQPTSLLNDTPPSRAGSLPQGTLSA
jgi:hypothetical protein